MKEAISAAEANRNFSRLLRSVRDGHSYVVTSHGQPVAQIVSASSGGALAGAKTALLARLERQPVLNIGRWSRDELYEDAR